MTTACDVEDASRARAVVAQVLDPELPVLTLDELGVLRDVRLAQGCVEVVITPTYVGCPAMDAIRQEIEKTLYENGFSAVRVSTVLSPAWTTDWMSTEGRRKLTDYGIAPPGRAGAVVPLVLSVRCPQCASLDTREVSRFGSTACKALWSCNTCLEPFDHFKAI